MDLDILDSQRNGQNNSLLITTGIFAYLMISGVSYSAFFVLKDVLINMSYSRGLIMWVLEIVNLLIIVIASIFTAKSIKTSSAEGAASLKSTLRNLIILFVLTQVLQFIYSYYRFGIWPDDFIDKMDQHMSSITGLLPFAYISPIFDVLKYLAVGVIFLKNEL